jgi:hypothetical protein
MHARMHFIASPHPVLSFVSWVASTLVATAAFWLTFGACVDQPLPDPEPQARLVVSWDPTVCGDPHRIVVELEDAAGVPLSRSVPCIAAGMTLDIPHWGVYRGRVYAWTYGPEIRSELTVRVDVDAPIVNWTVDTPR